MMAHINWFVFCDKCRELMILFILTCYPDGIQCAKFAQIGEHSSSTTAKCSNNIKYIEGNGLKFLPHHILTKYTKRNINLIQFSLHLPKNIATNTCGRTKM